MIFLYLCIIIGFDGLNVSTVAYKQQQKEEKREDMRSLVTAD